MTHSTLSPAHSPRARHWSDLVVILVGVTLFALAVWPRDPDASSNAGVDIGHPQWQWIAHIVASAAAISSVFLAQRRGRSGLPRTLLWIGALALIAAFIVSLTAGVGGPRPWLTLLLPAVLLAAASMGVGPMPRTLDSHEASDSNRR